MPDPFWLRFLPLAMRRQLIGKVNLHAIIHNSGWLLIDRMTRLLLGLLVGAWVARYLSPANFGELTYILAYIAFFQAIANLGLDGIVVRDIAHDKAFAAQVLGTAFIARFAAGVACWLAAISGMAWMHGLTSPSVAMTALAGGSLIFQAADTIDLWFQSQSQSRRTVLAKLIAYVASNGVKIALILTKAPLIAFAAVMALEILMAAISLALAYKLFPASGRWQFLASRARPLIHESWPYMLSGLSITIYMRIDQIMLKNMLGEAEVGLYAAVLPLSQLWNFIPMILVSSLAPFMARMRQESNAKYRDALLKIFRTFGVMAIIAALLTAMFSSLIVSLLYGPSYARSGPILAIHVFTNLFVFQGVAQTLWLLNQGLGIYSLYKTAIGALVAILANYLLIPRYGLYGAAISANISYASSAVLSNLWLAPDIFKMQLGINPGPANEKRF